MSEDTPDLPPVSSLDRQAARTLRHSERTMALIVALLVVCLAALGYLYQQKAAATSQLQALARQQAGETARIDARVRRDVASICGFMRIIGTVQITPKATPILVQWTESARVAYYGHGCSPALPPPSAEMRAKAAQFGVPLTR